MLEREHLRYPHLMLPDVGGDYAIALGEIVHLGNDVVRRDALTAIAVFVKRLILLPLEDLLMPFRPIGVAPADTLAAFDRGQHIDEHRLDVADNRDINLDVLGDRGRVDVYMDDGFGFGCELGNLAGDAIVEARTDRDQTV